MMRGVVVVHGPFVLQRPRPHRLMGPCRPTSPHRHCHHCPWAICPAEATSPSLSGGGAVLSLPTLSLSSSVGHLSCRGHVPVIIWWGGCVVPPHVVIVIVHRPFVLWRPHRHCCPVGAFSSSSAGLLSCGGLVPSLSSGGLPLVSPC